LRIEHYLSASGQDPFQQWFDSLDRGQRVIVERRIVMVEEFGHIGDSRSLGGGLFEMRLMGPGLRIYFANTGVGIILMLGGSNKSSQNRAIRIARNRLQDFKERM